MADNIQLGSGSQVKAVQDQLLTNALIGYFPEGFISDSIFPMIQHAQYTGKIGVFGKNHLRIENSGKVAKGAYRRVDVAARSTTSFEIKGHGLSDIVTKYDYANVNAPFDAELEATMGLASLLFLEQEYAVATALTSSSIITQYINLGASTETQYNDTGNSDPLADFQTARAAVKAGCGLPPDSAIVPWEVANVLRYHPQMLDALGFKWERPGGLTDVELAVAMGVKKIFVPLAMYNSAYEGGTDTLAAVWGKHIVFGVMPEKPSKYQVSVGYMVRPADGSPRKVYKNPLFNPPGSTEILCENEYDALISNANAAYLLQNVIA